MMITNSTTLVSWTSRMLGTVFTMVSLTGLLSVTASTSSAQIRSEWTSVDASYASYTTPYQCRAAIIRIGRRALGLEDYDTMSVQAVAAQTHVPNEAKDAADQCLRRIVVDSLTREELMPMAGLYLAAGRDKDAAAMVERMLNGQWNHVATDSESLLSVDGFADTDSNTRKAVVHNMAATTYLNSTPARLSEALSHLNLFEQLAPEQRVVLVTQYYAVFRKAREFGDSTAMNEASQHLIDLGEKLTTTERQNMRGILFAAEQYRTAKIRFDSLRLSTDAYITLQKSQLYKLDISDRLLGSTMDTLQGEFRFPAAPVYPIPGKISLVMVLGSAPMSANIIFPMLRRLKQKHADLEILYVSQTAGQLGTALLDPVQQAETERHWVQDVWKLPISVLIEKSSTWRLPDPDRRLVFGATSSETYKDRFWLVDRAGTIVYHCPISKEPEAELDRLITALRQQR